MVGVEDVLVSGRIGQRNDLFLSDDLRYFGVWSGLQKMEMGMGRIALVDLLELHSEIPFRSILENRISR
jgi:hypothetical protein